MPEFVPKLVDGMTLVNPFPGEVQTGEDITFSGLYDELKEAIRADDPQLLGEEFKPPGGWKVADWDQARSIAETCLAERSKDFRVAGYLARALAEQQGLAGIREGLWLLNELLVRYWDDLYPTAPKVRDGKTGEKVRDAAPRAQELEVVFGHFNAKLAEWPACAESAEASEIERVLDQVSDLEEEIARLEETVAERFVTATPDTRSLRAALSAYAGSFERVARQRDEAQRLAAEEEARAREETERAELEAQRAAEAEAARREAEERERRDRMGRLGIDAADAESATSPPDDEDAWLMRLAVLARWLRRRDPRNPLGYRLVPLAAWSVADFDRRAPEPPSEARQELARLVAAEDWEAVVDLVHKFMAKPWGRGWMDPLYALDRAIQAQTAPDGEVLDAYQADVRELLRRYPEAPGALLQDGSDASGEEALRWFEALRDGELADGEDDRRPGGLSAEDLEQAVTLYERGHMAAALSHLRMSVERATSAREQFVCRVDLARFLAEHGQGGMAAQIYRDLAETIEQRGLTTWESPRLLSRVYQGLLWSARHEASAFEDAERIARRAFERLCVLDPALAVESQS